jgi:hypothetical protein
MNLGFAAQRTTKTVEFDPVYEFRKGVEFLKNEYPQKALVRLQRAYNSDKLMPTILRFLDWRSRVRSGSGIKPRSFAKLRCN